MCECVSPAHGMAELLLCELLTATAGPAAVPFSPQILEDYLLMEDAPLLEEMAEEDEELDLYNEMTFGLDHNSTEEDATKTLVSPERSTELLGTEEPPQGAEGQPPTEEQEEPQDEGGTEPEVEQVGSEEEEEEDEEQGAEEQVDEEEPNDLGDPAVMRAVQSKPTLEVMPGWGGRGP